MGFVMNKEDFSKTIEKLSQDYRLYAPVVKKGEGRCLDEDIVRYDFIKDADEIELELKSDYSFKEILLPLSETLFYFTENETKVADRDLSDVLVFLRSCDLHGLQRLDDMYLRNGREKDFFYNRIRKHVHFVLIGCTHSYKDCFCVSMGANKIDDGYVFSIEQSNDGFKSEIKDDAFASYFVGQAENVAVSYVTENETKVHVPDRVPLSIYKSDMWREYDVRCIGCGRCTLVCPTCTCFTMQDTFYDAKGKVGERRRVNASCMIDGYTNVAGGGSYRQPKGERMRFKVLHKVNDFKARFGYNMCTGCGRCDAVCPEYISFSTLINKLDAEIKKEAE